MRNFTTSHCTHQHGGGNCRQNWSHCIQMYWLKQQNTLTYIWNKSLY